MLQLPTDLRLFRFFSFGECRALPGFVPFDELFRARKMYLSDPNNFNDPFDPIPSFEEVHSQSRGQAALQLFASQDVFYSKVGRSISLEEAKRIINENWNQHYDKWLEIWMQLLGKEMRVLCLTSDISSNLMWSHYARVHSGFAVELNLDRDPWKRVIEDGVIHEVIYQLKRPAASVSGMAEARDLFYKSDEWKYEKEWRVITRRSDSNLETDRWGQYLKLDKDSLKGLYLGWKCEITDRLADALKSIQDSFPGIEIYRAKPDRLEYKLVFNRT